MRILQRIFPKISASLACMAMLLLSPSTSFSAPNDTPAHNQGTNHDPTDQTPPAHQEHHDSIAGLPGVDQTQFDAGLGILNNPTFQHLFSLLPAIIASMSDHGDGSADPDLIEQAREDINSGSLPEVYRRIGNNILNFFFFMPL